MKYQKVVPSLLPAFVLTCTVAFNCLAQATTPAPAPQSSPTTSGEPPDQIKVFVEEVRIPVFVTDEYRRFDPSLEAEDLLVLEDQSPQQVRSVRRIPSSVLLLLDTTEAMNPAMSTKTTREVSTRLVGRLRDGDQVAAIQFGGRVELIQNWTTETPAVVQALRAKLVAGQPSRLSEALTLAAAKLKETPAGSRHVVLITDGVAEAGERATLTEAIGQALTANATLHVISYTSIGRKALKQSNPLVKVTGERRRNAQDVAEDILNPTGSSDTKQHRKVYVNIDTDLAMRRRRGEYEEALRRGEQWLTALAEETGGVLALPQSVEELLKQGDAVAREIGTQYVVTYTPKRPLAAAQGEYRQLRVISRRAGLHARSRRGYVATPP